MSEQPNLQIEWLSEWIKKVMLRRIVCLYLINGDIIHVCVSPELGVDIDDLQSSDHHVLRLLGAAWRLPECGVQEREAEGERRGRQWSHIWGKNKTQRNKNSQNYQNMLHDLNQVDTR